MPNLYDLVQYSDAAREGRLRLVGSSRKRHACLCPQRTPRGGTGLDAFRLDPCAHAGCDGRVEVGSSYVRDLHEDTFHGEAVCLPCAAAVWGVAEDELRARREQDAAESRAAIQSMFAAISTAGPNPPRRLP